MKYPQLSLAIFAAVFLNTRHLVCSESNNVARHLTNSVTIKSSFEHLLNEGIADRCPAPNTFSGGKFFIPAPRDVDMFHAFQSPSIEKLLLEFAHSEFKSDKKSILSIVKANIGPIVVGGIGLLVVVGALLSICCINKSFRKCMTCMTCGMACRDRSRKVWALVNPVKEYLTGAWVMIFGVIGLLLGCLFISSATNRMFSGYLATGCDADMSIFGAFFGGRSVDIKPSNPAVNWIGFEGFDQIVATVHHTVNPSAQVLRKETQKMFVPLSNNVNNDLRELSLAANATGDSIKAAQTTLLSVAMDHQFVVAENPTMISDIGLTVSKAVSAGLTSTENVLDQLLGPNSSAIQGAYQYVGDVYRNVHDILDDVRKVYIDNYKYIQNVPNATAFGIKTVLVLIVLIAFVVMVATVGSYCCLGLYSMQRTSVDTMLRRSFACNYVCLGLYAGLNIILVALLYAFLLWSSSSCKLVQQDILQNGRFDIFGNLNDTAMTVAQTCLAVNGTGDLLQALNIRDYVNKAKVDFNKTANDLNSSVTTIFTNVDYTNTINKGRREFVDLSWLVLPNKSSVNPTEVFPDYLLTGSQLSDVDIACDTVPLGVLVPTCSSGNKVTVRGLLSVNKYLNDAPTNKVYCLNQLRTIPGVIGCTAANPKYITDSLNPDVDTDIQTQFAALGGLTSVLAKQWISAVRLSVTKERLNSQQAFSCGPTPCGLTTFAPYVDLTNTTSSPFASSVTKNINHVGTAMNDITKNGEIFAKSIAGYFVNLVNVPFTHAVNGANCTYVRFVASQVSNDLCDLLLPSTAGLLIGFSFIAVCSLLLAPLSWMIYHYTSDIMDIGVDGPTNAEINDMEAGRYGPTIINVTTNPRVYEGMPRVAQIVPVAPYSAPPAPYSASPPTRSPRVMTTHAAVEQTATPSAVNREARASFDSAWE